MTTENTRVVLRHPLQGIPREDDFELQTEAVAEPRQRELLVRHRYIALDPWQRSALAGRHSANQLPMGGGDMPPAETIGTVVQSQHPEFAAGATVRCMGGWQEYSISDGTGVQLVDPDAAPLSTCLGILGMPGLTAWASIVRLADVQAGQTVLVSAAHGPVGSMVGQIAMQKGARAVGIAGGAEKCGLVTSALGFDNCIDYKSAAYPDNLRAALPDGADIYHDNVGGQMLLDAISVMKEYGTIILCGLISQYNDPGKAVDLPLALPIMKRLTLKGLVVYDHNEAQQEFFATAAAWVRDGKVKYLEDISTGIASAPGLFAKLMRGDNTGKTLVDLGD